MKEWVTIKDISEALNLTRRAVQAAAVKKGWPAREVKSANGGRAMKEFRLSCLPKEDQDKIAKYFLDQKLRSTDIMSVPARLPAAASTEGSGLSIESGALSSEALCLLKPNGDLTNTNIQAKRLIVPERADSTGLARFNLVCAWRDMLDTQPHGKKVEATSAFLLAYNSGSFLPAVYAKIGEVSESTLRDMGKRLRASRAENNGNEDYRALCDGRGGWKKYGTTLWRPRSISNDAKDVFLSCWLRPERPTVSLAIRAARMMLERRGIVEESDDRTWRRWLDDWSKRSQHIIVLAREGEKAYRDKIAPYITRDDSLLEPGQVLIADGHDLNFDILHPYTGRPSRLKLVMFIDWASRMPAGWQIMPTESSTVIHAALRNAIINLGRLPQIVYLDNGRAFKAKVFTQSEFDLTELNGVYARLGIATMFAQPYNARSKPIERWFETLNEQFERMMSEYTGASIDDKPAWRARNEKFHKSMHARRTGGWVPDIREAAHLVNLYIQWYGQQEHSGIHFRKPAEVLAAGRGPGVDLAELNDQLLWPKRVTPHRCRVTLFNIDYESDALHGLGEDVIVKYDCSDLSKVWFHTLQGEYLGEGVPVEALNPIARQLGDGIGVDQVRKEIERQRRLAKSTKEGLVELGATSAQIDSLGALPWREKAAVLPGGRRTEDGERKEIEAPIPEEERARLELVVSNAEAEIREKEQKAVEIERPEYFRSELDRYDWCWRAVHQHKADIGKAELTWMEYFEQTAEFESKYADRYEDLARLYS